MRQNSHLGRFWPFPALLQYYLRGALFGRCARIGTEDLMPPRARRGAIDYWPAMAISVHGIRTDGRWQKTFASAMSASPAKVESFEYGRYGLFWFLISPCNTRL